MTSRSKNRVRLQIRTWLSKSTSFLWPSRKSCKSRKEKGKKSYSIFSETKTARYYMQTPKYMHVMSKQLILNKATRRMGRKMLIKWPDRLRSRGADLEASVKINKFLSPIFSNNIKIYSKQDWQQKHS